MKIRTCFVGNMRSLGPLLPRKLRTGETVAETNELYWPQAGELEGLHIDSFLPGLQIQKLLGIPKGFNFRAR